MFNPILIPLDGSELAECVLPHAAAIADSFNAEMTLLHILEKGRANAAAPIFDLLNWQIAKTQAALYLEKKKNGYDESGLRTRVAVLEGHVPEGIIEYAQNNGTKLIIISSHGQAGLTPWGISSVTQKIILSAAASVLIVRASQQAAPSVSYRRILVPLDGSQRAENVLPAITQLARAHQAQIHLVQVVQTPEMARQLPLAQDDISLSEQMVERNRAEASRYLEQVQTRSYLDGIAVQTHVLASDNAAVELHRIVEQEQVDLVTLNAHGYTGNQQLPYGNMVNNFILHGVTPLLIVQDYPARQESPPLEVPAREYAER